MKENDRRFWAKIKAYTPAEYNGHVVSKSPWGYHPCDLVTHRKLKSLFGVVMLMRRLDAQYQRWEAKLPHNRKGPRPVICSRLSAKDRERIIYDFRAAGCVFKEDEANSQMLKLQPSHIDTFIGLIQKWVAGCEQEGNLPKSS